MNATVLDPQLMETWMAPEEADSGAIVELYFAAVDRIGDEPEVLEWLYWHAAKHMALLAASTNT